MSQFRSYVSGVRFVPAARLLEIEVVPGNPADPSRHWFELYDDCACHFHIDLKLASPTASGSHVGLARVAAVLVDNKASVTLTTDPHKYERVVKAVFAPLTEAP